jgi:tetratricopeptide (TPR) repeat protein
LLLFGDLSTATAHDGPNEVIEQLTLKMERQGRSAELLYQRASEYRTLGKLSRASADLRAALQRSPEYFPAWLELSRIQLAQGEADAALQSINEGLHHASAGDRPVGLMQRSEVLTAKGELEQALADVSAAIAKRPDQVDWYLQQSTIRAKLGEPAESAEGLAAGWRATQSGALLVAWIDAMIDAGQAEDALAKIEPELAETRFASSWLIRRARCWLLLGKTDAARDDLRRAIDEITPRIHSLRPDTGLIVDRGFAHALLGEMYQARADLELARQHHAEPTAIERLERAVEGSAESGLPNAE